MVTAEAINSPFSASLAWFPCVALGRPPLQTQERRETAAHTYSVLERRRRRTKRSTVSGASSQFPSPPAIPSPSLYRRSFIDQSTTDYVLLCSLRSASSLAFKSHAYRCFSGRRPAHFSVIQSGLANIDRCVNWYVLLQEALCEPS